MLYCIHDHNTPHGAWNGMFNSSQLRGGMRCKIPEHYSENVFTVTHHHHHQGFYCGGGAWERPAAGRVARRSSPAPALAPFPVPGRSSLWTASCCWGGWLVLLLRGCNACRAVGGGLQSGAALIGIRLDVGSLPPRSSSLTVTGCRLGGFPVRRDRWGGERVVGGVLPRISVGTWGLCARLCLVLVCGGRYGLGEGFFSSSWDRVWAE